MRKILKPAVLFVRRDTAGRSYSVGTIAAERLDAGLAQVGIHVDGVTSIDDDWSLPDRNVTDAAQAG